MKPRLQLGGEKQPVLLIVFIIWAGRSQLPMQSVFAAGWADVPTFCQTTRSAALLARAHTGLDQDEGRGTRRLVVNAKRLSYTSGENVRLVPTVTDVTNARVTKRSRQDLAVNAD